MLCLKGGGTRFEEFEVLDLGSTVFGLARASRAVSLTVFFFLLGVGCRCRLVGWEAC